MKFLPLRDFDIVTSALNFDTPDCHVTGGCDLYTTKAAGSDKKLYKDIDTSLQTQHAALLTLGASLSPPQRKVLAASHQLSRSSPFGNLAELANRRTYAYLIATLNASHPDYDFSHVLRPGDFKRERNLKMMMSNVDSTLSNVRPVSLARDGSAPRSFSSPAGFAAMNAHEGGGSNAPLWGPQMWAMVDKEMRLNDCTIFSYQPADDPFDDEEGAIWALHYFFFNKTLKRVAYLHLRGVPVMSHSPRLRPHQTMAGRRKRGGVSIDAGANKRARFWLGDRYAERITTSDDDMDDDGLLWNRGKDGEFEGYQGYDNDDDDDDDDGEYDDERAEYDEDDESDDDQANKPPVRNMSEDIAARMEIE